MQVAVAFSLSGVLMSKELDFAAERENWNVYRLEDGTVVKMRIMLAAVKRDGSDEKGEPKYQLSWQQAIHIEASELAKAQETNK